MASRPVFGRASHFIPMRAEILSCGMREMRERSEAEIKEELAGQTARDSDSKLREIREEQEQTEREAVTGQVKTALPQI